MKRLDLSGQRFGRWTVTSRQRRNKWGAAEWRCRCDCGVTRWVLAQSLRARVSRSCGCLVAELAAKANTTHGHASHRRWTPEYSSWVNMIQRCLNPKTPHYPHYGGRGITVCPRWRASFKAFLADMGERPADRTLDRIDNDGNYEPGTCRWATDSEQRQNQRRSRSTAA